MQRHLLQRPDGLPKLPKGSKSWYHVWRVFGKCKNENFVFKINDIEVYPSSIEFYAQRELNWKLGILRDELRAAETPKSRSNNILLGSIANFDYTQFTNAIRIRKEIKKLEKRLVKCQRIK